MSNKAHAGLVLQGFCDRVSRSADVTVVHFGTLQITLGKGAPAIDPARDSLSIRASLQAGAWRCEELSVYSAGTGGRPAHQSAPASPPSDCRSNAMLGRSQDAGAATAATSPGDDASNVRVLRSTGGAFSALSRRAVATAPATPSNQPTGKGVPPPVAHAPFSLDKPLDEEDLDLPF